MLSACPIHALRYRPAAAALPKRGCAALLILFLFAASGVSRAQIPAAAEARTTKTLASIGDEWVVRTCLEAYKTGTHHDPKWDQQAVALIKDIATQLLTPEDRQKRVEASQQLLATGCTDPVACRTATWSIVHWGSYPKEAWPWLRKTRDMAQAADCPSIVRYLVLTDVLAAFKGTAEPEARESDLARKASEAFADGVAAGAYRDDEIRQACDSLHRKTYLLSGNAWMETVLMALEARPGVNRWLLNMVKGQVYIAKAWRARGRGFASAVDAQQWKGFAENLAVAREALVAAYDERKDCPESAVEMIRVTMGDAGVPGLDEKAWFYRAVQADASCEEAYSALSWALRPRWHGSLEQLHAFGVECLRSGRYDAGAPFFYTVVLRNMSDDFPPTGWRQIYRRKEVQANLDELFTNITEKRKDYSAEIRRQILADRIATMAWGGRYDEAKALVPGINGPVDPRFQAFGTALTQNYQVWSDLVAELDAFTGPSADQVKAAEDAYLRGDLANAGSLFRALLSQSQDVNTRLTAANRLGWIAMLQNAANDPEAHGYNEHSLLLWLTLRKMMPQIMDIVSNGGSMLIPDDDAGNLTLLNWACENEPQDEVMAILNCPGAKDFVNHKDNYDRTPWSIAKQKGYTQATDKMAQLGANVPKDNKVHDVTVIYTLKNSPARVRGR